MSNTIKPTTASIRGGGVPNPQQGSRIPASPNASDLLTVSDILQAIGIAPEKIASVPALRSLSHCNICAIQGQGQPVKLVSKTVWGRNFPNFVAGIAPAAPSKPVAPLHASPNAGLNICAPSRSLPNPIATAPAKSNIKPAKGLIKKATQTHAVANAGSTSSPISMSPAAFPPLPTSFPMAFSKSNIKPVKPVKVLVKKTTQVVSNAGTTTAATVATKAPTTTSQQIRSNLGPAFDEAAPSFYDPSTEGPFSKSKTFKNLKFLHLEGQILLAEVERLEDCYLENVKRHVAVNNLPGKGKLIVPEAVHEQIVEYVYKNGIAYPSLPPHQVRPLKIKSAVAPTEVKKPSSPATPATPITPVTPVVETQLMKAPLQSQDSILSTFSEYNSESPFATPGVEATTTAAVVGNCIDKAKAVVEMKKKEVSSDRIFLLPLIEDRFVEDADLVSFSCGGPSLVAARAVFSDAAKKSIKKPLLAIRRLLRKKKNAKNTN